MRLNITKLLDFPQPTVFETGLISNCERINRILVLSIAGVCKLNGSATDTSLCHVMMEVVEAVHCRTPINFLGCTLNSLPELMRHFYTKLPQTDGFHKRAKSCQDQVVKDCAIISQDFSKVGSWIECGKNKRLLCAIWNLVCNGKIQLSVVEPAKGSVAEIINSALQSLSGAELGNLYESFADYIIITLSETVGNATVQRDIDYSASEERRSVRRNSLYEVWRAFFLKI